MENNHEALSALTAANCVLSPQIVAEKYFEEDSGPPVLRKAQLFRERHMIRFEKERYEEYVHAKVCKMDLKELGRYGIGLELYFLAIKQVGFVFFIISLVSLWPLMENYYGNGLTPGQQKQPWDVLTLANQYQYSILMTEFDAEMQVNSYKNSKIRLVIADILYTMIFVFFIAYLHIITRDKIKISQKSNASADEYAIEVTGFPEEVITAREVKKHFHRFGPIIEVYLARKYDGVLGDYKERADLMAESVYYKRLENEGLLTIKKKKELEKIQEKIKKFDEKIQEREKTSCFIHDELPVIRAYIIFGYIKDKDNCIRTYNKSHGCSRKYNNDLKFRGFYNLKVSQTSEPSNIIWENIEYSPWKRRFNQFIANLIACVLIFISIIIIYSLKSYNDGLPDNDQCISTYNVDPRIPISSAKILYTSQEQNFCYCSNVLISTILQDSDLRDFCNSYLTKRSKTILIRVFSSLFVVALNYLLKIVFIFLGRFEKAPSRSKEQVKIMTKVFIVLFINTAIVVLLVNGNFSALGFIPYLPFKQYMFNSQFNDFTRQWYVQVGSTITTTLIICIFSPHIVDLVINYPFDFCKRRYYKRYKTQRDINKAFRGPEFEIATRYSQILNVIFTSFLYSSGIPLLNLTCCCTMFVLYWTDKCLVLNHYSKPPRYSATFNKQFISMLPLAAILHCGFSLWMMGSESIYPQSFHTDEGYLCAYPNTIYDRIFSISGFSCIYISILAFSVYLYVNSSFIFTWCKRRKKNMVHSESGHSSNRFFRDEIDDIKEHGLHTYKILENPNYRELILGLNTAAEAVEKLKSISKRSSEVELFDTKSKLNSERELLDSKSKVISDNDYRDNLLNVKSRNSSENSKSRSSSGDDCRGEVLDSKSRSSSGDDCRGELLDSKSRCSSGDECKDELLDCNSKGHSENDCKDELLDSKKIDL